MNDLPSSYMKPSTKIWMLSLHGNSKITDLYDRIQNYFIKTTAYYVRMRKFDLLYSGRTKVFTDYNEVRWKLNSNKTEAHDIITWKTTAHKTLKKIIGFSTRIKLNLTILLTRPRNSMINFTIYCSYSTTCLFRVTVCVLWRSQTQNISSLSLIQ